MDNLTHSLVGLAAGELIHRYLPDESDAAARSLRHRLLLTACWAASNFPDLDLFLTPLLPAPLGYLLHHRGHTHTLFYALPQALLLWAMLWLLWPGARSLLKSSVDARKGLALALAAGFGLHLLMDAMNSYGIHPFHPFDSRWLFGDMVFILEPVFWIAFGIPLVLMVQSGWARVLLLALLLGAPLFFTLKGFLHWASLGALLLLALALGGLQHKTQKRSIALLLAFGIAIGFVGIQAFASREATHLVAARLKAEDPSSRLLDAAMTAFPANPLCWMFVSVESRDDAGTYRLRRGRLSLMPAVLPVSQCPAGFAEGEPAGAADDAIVLFYREDDSLAVLRTLQREDCHVDAWLRFARMPSVNDTEASDLRYASRLRENFTTLDIDKSRRNACPGMVPGWAYPRKDLLTPGG
ncbi:metal-dependent hydrolase [Noviherbaspirillum massiliense]|uniref:metal-dependent hydrolase n=1 Tax=Noviherbaspirillum massiliense TaxID=1465823 RepID=UPI000313A7EC|nr:metal-dependent hydrolase [Noviherbaspirillum massiliense]